MIQPEAIRICNQRLPHTPSHLNRTLGYSEETPYKKNNLEQVEEYDLSMRELQVLRPRLDSNDYCSTLSHSQRKEPNLSSSNELASSCERIRTSQSTLEVKTLYK